jgi:hypothetical protein
MAEDEQKKGEGAPPPPSETILDSAPKERDPDEAVLAEDSIHSYAVAALDHFRESAEKALDGVVGWIESQGSVDELNHNGVTARLGASYLDLLLGACGGKDTPIGAKLFEEIDSEIDWAVRNEVEATTVVGTLSRCARDFSWYIRDNLQYVLSHQWDQLRDLAYGGSTDYVALLHALGMPQFSWTGESLQSGMIAVAENVLANKPKTAQEAEDKDPKRQEQEQQQILVQEEEKALRAT